MAGVSLGMDFVDFTCVTELERITAKLAKKELKFTFKGVPFELKKVESGLDGNGFFKNIPNYQFTDISSPARWFNCGVFWLLMCAEEDRIVSEPSARLLLSALLLSGMIDDKLPVFMAVGDGEWRGFQRGSDSAIQFYEARRQDLPVENALSRFEAREWKIPATFTISYPKGFGFFDDWCPIQSVRIEAVWPKIRTNPEDGDASSFGSAPIWTVSCSMWPKEKWPPMRHSMQRILLNGHLRELCQVAEREELPSLTAVPIFGALSDSAEMAAYRRALDANEADLVKIIAAIYANEVKRMEGDGWTGGLGPVVWQNMRFTRISEKLALVWRHFLKILEAKRWQNLQPVNISAKGTNDLLQQLQLFNWCIERERQWQKCIEEAGFVAGDLLPALPKFSFSASTSLDLNEALTEKSQEIESKIESFKDIDDDVLDPEPVVQSPQELTTSVQRIGKLEHDFDFGTVWIPLTLNCQPPPPNLPLPPSAPLAGEIVALAQLKSDMAAFKAANAELLEASESDAFTAFLLWHSPNDVERDASNGQAIVSSRMLDPSGQWQLLWKESEAQALNPQSFRAHVSFNHRSLAGQLLSDWHTRWNAQMLLEALVPEIIQTMLQKQGELSQLLGQATPEELTDDLCQQVPFPLDKLTEALDAQEEAISLAIASRQLNLRREPCWLLVDETERSRLLQLGSFESVREEVVGVDCYWRWDRETGAFSAKSSLINL